MLDRGWPSAYPPTRLRDEALAMADAWLEVLVEALPPRAIRSIYLSGSSQRPWDTPLDYVPELSDVDVHLWLRSESDIERLEGGGAPFEIRDRVMRGFRRRVPRALHLPRPQLTIVNRLYDIPDYVPSPEGAVTLLTGEAYPSLSLSEAQRERQRERDRENLMQHRAFLDALPHRVIDRPGPLLTQLVHEIAWRVSPTAARVLSLRGRRYEDVWTLNRSALNRELMSEGLDDLARAYRSFYLGGWAAFLDEGDDGPAASLRAGAEALDLAMDLAARS